MKITLMEDYKAPCVFGSLIHAMTAQMVNILTGVGHVINTHWRCTCACKCTDCFT